MVSTFGPVGKGRVLPGLSGGAAGDGLLAAGGVGGPGAGAGGGVEDVAGGEGSLDALQRLGGDGLRVPLEELMRLMQLLLVLLVASRYSPPSAAASAAAAGAAADGKGAGSSWPPREPKTTTREAAGEEDWKAWSGGESMRTWLSRRRQPRPKELGFPLDAD